MVQDQLDPEYYEAYDSRGRSNHFGDHSSYCGLADEHNENNNEPPLEESKTSSGVYHQMVGNNNNSYPDCLAERIPLVVVPIPFASDWLFRGIIERKGNSNSNSNSRSGDQGGVGVNVSSTANSKSAVVSPVSKGERKRGFDDVVPNNDDGDDQDETMSDYPNPSSASHTNNDTKNNSEADSNSQPTRQKKATVLLSSNETPKEENRGGEAMTTTDWWPAGTCGTSVDECPVLAKLCYDELLAPEEGMENAKADDDVARHRSSRSSSTCKLMLNDIVSFVGVLSMNPWDADFSGQQPSSSNTNTASGTDSIVDCRGWDSMTDTVPPPSRLPRLHVLSYQKLDLDGLARRAINVETNNYGCCKDDEQLLQMPEEEERGGIVCGGDSPSSKNNDSHSHSNSDDDSEVEWSGFPPMEQRNSSSPMSMTSQSLKVDGPFGSLTSMEAVPWIRSLWLCLLSEAERRTVDFDSINSNNESPKIIRAGPEERALGCLSLQLSTPDVASARSLYHDLAENILPGLCPVVACVDFAAAELEPTSFVPRKDHNSRLKPCPLQLPRGSVLLVHYPPSHTNNANNNDRPQNSSRSKGGSEIRNNNNNNNMESILRELVQHHKIPYRFEGGMTIPFEADYRVIVVTTQTQELPCTLSALTRTGAATPSPLSASPSKRRLCPTKPELRDILAKGRSLKNTNDGLKFSSLLLERGQKEFLERRKRCYESSPSSPLPGEDDFHRWLTMTRLQTKSRLSRDERLNETSDTTPVGEDMGQQPADLPVSTQYFEPLVEDWDAALKLDDDLRCAV